jgi:histidinol phosphatase-like enzyme
MLLSAISDFELNPSKTLYIGDDDRDLKAAEAAGISGILVGSEHSNQTIFPNVSDALTAIKDILIRVE